MADTKKTETFTAEERAAMKQRAKELKENASNEDALKDLFAKIAEMAEPDRVLAERIHEIITTAAPELTPKLWYGMPGYNKNGKVVVFFQDAAKFKARYATLGFSDVATVDDGTMWPVAYALTTLTAANEKTIVSLVKKAIS
jgi:uncharacterized protein YdhG (YjbR/CyaY superfamily)